MSKAKSEFLDRLIAIRDQLNRLVRDVDEDTVLENKTHLSRLVEVFEKNGNQWLTVKEAAIRAYIEPKSARGIIYGHKNLFAKAILKDGVHVVWRLNK